MRSRSDMTRFGFFVIIMLINLSRAIIHFLNCPWLYNQLPKFILFFVIDILRQDKFLSHPSKIKRIADGFQIFRIKLKLIALFQFVKADFFFNYRIVITQCEVCQTNQIVENLGNIRSFKLHLSKVKTIFTFKLQSQFPINIKQMTQINIKVIIRVQRNNQLCGRTRENI